MFLSSAIQKRVYKTWHLQLPSNPGLHQALATPELAAARISELKAAGIQDAKISPRISNRYQVRIRSKLARGQICKTFAPKSDTEECAKAREGEPVER